MDINGFREPQSPWFFTQPSEYLVETHVKKNEAPIKNTQPTPDNRYPQIAAQMDDGRLVTDYRPNCSKNVAAGQQFATRKWMQKNGSELIHLSRKRQAEATGAGTVYDSRIEAAPLAYVMCDQSDCGLIAGTPGGIGIERKDKAPKLFGTFAASVPGEVRDSPMLTKVYEGGRNTVRGRF